MFKDMLRAVLLVLAAFGALVALVGLWATLTGTSIALPGLGLIVSGGVFLMFGLLVMAVALAILWSLRNPYR